MEKLKDRMTKTKKRLTKRINTEDSSISNLTIRQLFLLKKELNLKIKLD